MAIALFGIGLLIAFAIGREVRADSHESVTDAGEVAEPLEQVAGDAGEQVEEEVEAGKKRGDADPEAAARGRKAKGKKARADEKAAKRKAKGRGKEKREGGQAREHRSERAAERANSQWQEDAARGQERAGAVREAGEGAAEAAPEELDAELGDAAGETPEQGSKGRRGKGEPPEQAKGFWSRFFGFGGDDEE
jgi:hypothetical protein